MCFKPRRGQPLAFGSPEGQTLPALLWTAQGSTHSRLHMLKPKRNIIPAQPPGRGKLRSWGGVVGTLVRSAPEHPSGSTGILVACWMMNCSVGKAKCYNKKNYLCTRRQKGGVQMLEWQGEGIFRELANCQASPILETHGTFSFFPFFSAPTPHP